MVMVVIVNVSFRMVIYVSSMIAKAIVYQLILSSLVHTKRV